MARENNTVSPEKQPSHKHSRSNPFAALLSGSRGNSQSSGPSPPEKNPLPKNVPRSQTEHNIGGHRIEEPLGEISNMQSRPLRKQTEPEPEPRSKSLHKRTKSALSLKGLAGRIWEDKDEDEEPHVQDHLLKSLKHSKKSKSSTNLSALWARPRSRGKDVVEQRVKDIENKAVADEHSRPPIWAQFASSSIEEVTGAPVTPITPDASATQASQATTQLPQAPQAILAAPRYDDETVDAEFEAVLDSRNVPDDVKDKMRTLETKLKAEFIRQHKTKSPTKGSSSSRDNLPASPTKRPRAETAGVDPSIRDDEGGSPKKARPRSFQLTLSKSSQSPTKKQQGEKQGSRGRSKSGELPQSVSSASLLGMQASKYSLSALVGGTRQSSPQEFIDYFHKPQKLQNVEVGRMQRLRQLLRNETVEWVDMFIAQGGMEEVVNLLYKIIEMEWRYAEPGPRPDDS